MMSPGVCISHATPHVCTFWCLSAECTTSCRFPPSLQVAFIPTSVTLPRSTWLSGTVALLTARRVQRFNLRRRFPNSTSITHSTESSGKAVSVLHSRLRTGPFISTAVGVGTERTNVSMSEESASQGMGRSQPHGQRGPCQVPSSWVKGRGYDHRFLDRKPRSARQDTLSCAHRKSSHCGFRSRGLHGCEYFSSLIVALIRRTRVGVRGPGFWDSTVCSDQGSPTFRRRHPLFVCKKTKTHRTGRPEGPYYTDTKK